MKRIWLMVLKNIFTVPYWYLKLCYYALFSKKISNEKKRILFKEIVTCANQGGNVTVRAYGLQNIPKDQPFMYFPNHQGLYDVLALLCNSPYFFSVVVKKELEHLPFLNKIFQIMGAYAIDRDDVRQSMKVIQKVSQEVAAGKNFLIFPEGTRSKNKNQVGSFKGGTFKAATKAKCPIVPVAIVDSYQVFDTNSIKPIVIQVHYLEPLYYEDYKMMKTTEIAELVEKKIKKVVDN